MSKVEDFIKDCTRHCSNELVSVQTKDGKKVISYNEWLNPEEARKVAEIAREEVIEKAVEWFNKFGLYKFIDVDWVQEEWYFRLGMFIEEFRKTMKESV